MENPKQVLFEVEVGTEVIDEHGDKGIVIFMDHFTYSVKVRLDYGGEGNYIIHPKLIQTYNFIKLYYARPYHGCQTL